MKMEQTECSETSAYKIQMPGNYPEENIQPTEHGESLKSGNSALSQLQQQDLYNQTHSAQHHTKLRCLELQEPLNICHTVLTAAPGQLF
jgi:hypothetical protein